MYSNVTVVNPNGTYRIPLRNIGEFRILVDNRSTSFFGDIVNKLGAWEHCGLTLEEAIKLGQAKKK